LFLQRRSAQFRYVSLALLAAVSVALTSCASSARPSASSIGAGDGLWHSPSGSCSRPTKTLLPNNTRLDSVVQTARCSAWAVGSYTSGRALIERWNGSTWSRVLAPGPKSNSALLAVSSTSPHDVWAVGIRHDATQRHARTLIDHWNGKTWSVVPSPDPKRPFNSAVLDSVSGRSPKDAWAAGYYQVGDVYKTLIEHWNGSGWRIVPSPDLAGSQTSSVLAAVSVAPHDRAWAVGYTSKGPAQWSLVERWDGRRWRTVPSPDPGQSGLESVTASSPTGTWAVGWSHHRTWNQPEIARWDGRSWHVVPCPHPGGHGLAELVSVTSTATMALAVGFYPDRSKLRALALAWNGTSWIVVQMRGLEGSRNADVNLGSASGIAFGRPWIVGFRYRNGSDQAFVLRP
jgi:hypothetical protein